MMNVESGWQMLICAPGMTADRPSGLAALSADQGWRPIRVPGTAAGALADQGADHSREVHDRDVWFRVPLPAAGTDMLLRLEGVATIAEAFLDDQPIGTNDSMFAPWEIAVDLRSAAMLHLCCRSLTAALARAPLKRARWRAPMIEDQRLRALRTTLLGHMPGWCPTVHAVGPYRPVLLIDPSAPPPPSRIVLRTAWDPASRIGTVEATLAWTTPPAREARLRVGPRETVLTNKGPGNLAATLTLPDAEPWWPWTHGNPSLHEAALIWDDEHIPLPPIGFRHVILDRGSDGRGFALHINGAPVFCRGAVWTSADLARLPCQESACLPLLETARAAGMNMIRVPGTGLYEADDFYGACDRLGIMVWQDFCFANLDYPRDSAFLSDVEREAVAFLMRTSGRACLTLLCGGSEVAQQAAMFGLARDKWDQHPVFDDVLPRLCAALRPGLPYVPHTPCGPDLPFRADATPAHYFGAGGYLRPPDDARLAGVRFASECLALANLPCAATMAETLPDVGFLQDPRWKAGVPRDQGASWDFEDVRDHYLKTLFGEDAASLRRDDSPRYLTLSRAVSGALMSEVFSLWRRADSLCAGGLVLALQDLAPGSGWGVLDSWGRPKPAWHALRSVLAPVQVLVLDEGLNGVAIHLANDTADAVSGVLELCAFRGAHPVGGAERQQVLVSPRQTVKVTAASVLGGFRDFAHAWRFGPPMADALRARLLGVEGFILSEHWLFPRRLLPPADLGMTARLEGSGSDWRLHLACRHLCQGVHVEDPNWRGETEWFHMAPGEQRMLRVMPWNADSASQRPHGRVIAINGNSECAY